MVHDSRVTIYWAKVTENASAFWSLQSPETITRFPPCDRAKYSQQRVWKTE